MYVHQRVLRLILQRVDPREGKLDCGQMVITEGHLVVVFNSRELFVNDLQGAFREIIHLQDRPHHVHSPSHGT